MLAVVLNGYGGPEVLTVQQLPDLVPGAEELLVEVAATALNRADLMQRSGRYPQPGPRPQHEIPGLEFAGRVTAIGNRVSAFSPGDEVMGILSGGGYASQVTIHERQAIPVPNGIALADAAAIPEVWLTAWDALVLQGDLAPGGTALIHGGGSGVGTAGIQLANWIGAKAVVTCSAGKVARCLSSAPPPPWTIAMVTRWPRCARYPVVGAQTWCSTSSAGRTWTSTLMRWR